MLSQHATDRSRYLFGIVAIVVCACVFTKTVAVVTEGLPLFSWGRARWAVFAILGYGHFAWLKGRFTVALRTNNYPWSYTRPAQDAALSMVVVPLGIVVGRNVFAVIYPWDPFLGAIVGALLAVFAWKVFASPVGAGAAAARTRAPTVVVQRGAEITPFEWAKAAAARLRQDERFGPFWWMGLLLPFNTEAPGAIVGSPGTAKTRILRMVMATILRFFTPGADLKAVVHDPKGDFISELHALGVTCPVHVMNPFDERATRWAIAEDVTPARADQVAAALMPDRKHDNNPFFYKAARGLVAATFVALAHRLPNAWTLRDLIHVMGEPKRLRRFLRSCPATRDIIRQLQITPRVFASVMQEVNNALNLLKPIAALWDSAPEGTNSISLAAWVKDRGNPSVLVLGMRHSKAENCQALNALMFSVLADTVLDEPEAKKQSRFFFIDELADTGQFRLNDLMRLGRSKGARFFLTFQNIPGLKARMSDEKVEEITGLIGNLSVFHVDCPKTAEWASQRIGDAEVLAELEQTSSGSTDSGRQTSHSWNDSVNQSLMTRRADLQGELLHLGAARQDATVTGYHMLREVNAVYRASLGFTYHDGDPEDDFRPRDDADTELRAWDDDDERRLTSGDVSDEQDDEPRNDTGGNDEGSDDRAPDDAAPRGQKSNPPAEPTKEAEDPLSRLKRIRRMDL